MQAGSKSALFVLVVLALGVGAFFALDLGGGEAPLPGQVAEEPGPASGSAAPSEAMRAEGGEAPEAAAPEAPAAGRTELAAAADVERRIALSGRLVGPDRAAVADTEIRYAEIRRLGLPGLERSLEPTVDGSGEVVRTDAGGRFRFVVRAGKAGRLTLPGDDWVFDGVRGDGVAVEAAAADHDLGALALARAAMLSGTVRDAGGRALAGVELGLSATGTLAGEGVPGFARYRTHSDDEGRFAFAGLPGARYRLTTASPKHLPRSEVIELAKGATRDDVVLTLESGASIWGRVTDDLGQPIEGATVGAFRTREMGEGMKLTALSAGESVQTDEKGEFELGGIEGAAVTVRASADGHRTSSRAEVRKGTGDLVLVLPRNAQIVGQLVDTAGQPIAGSTVRAVATSPGTFVVGRRGGATTDAEGNFHLENVAPGETSVEAEGDDHVTAVAKLDVQPGATMRDVRLIAARGASVEVTVVDPSGDPVEGATVEVREVPSFQHGPAGGSWSRSRRVERRVERDAGADHVEMFDDGTPRVLAAAVTGPDGRARIGGLEPGTVELHARHDELAPAVGSQVTLASSGTATAKLALRQGGAVVLSVVDADRAALADAKVVVEGPHVEGAAPERRTGTSDAEGEVRLGPLPAGAYTAALELPARPMNFGGASIVIAQSGNVLEGTRVPFAVRSGDTARAQLVHPVLTKLTGTLRDAAGPVAGGRIDVNPEGALRLPGSSAYRSETDGEGRFAIEGLPPGQYTLSYGRRDQLVKAEEDLELAGEREVERHLLLAGGTIRLTVMDGDGEPLRRAKITINRDDGSAGSGSRPRRPAMIAMVSIERDGEGGGGEQSMTLGGPQSVVYTDVDGVAEIEAVPPGKYRLAIEHGRHVDKSVEAEVVGNTVHDVGPVHLAFGGSVRGKIVAETGELPMVATVEIQRSGAAADDWRSTTAMRGSFNFTGLEPGRYRLRARRMAMGASPGESPPFGPIETVDIEPGQSARTDVRVK